LYKFRRANQVPEKGVKKLTGIDMSDTDEQLASPANRKTIKIRLENGFCHSKPGNHLFCNGRRRPMNTGAKWEKY
jgi:hypothetical protein